MQRPSLSLDELISDLVSSDQAWAGTVMVNGLSIDSRTVCPGDCFLACRGTASHGARYIAEALKAGAVAVLFETDYGELDIRAFDAPVIPVPGLGAKVGLLADRFFAHPSRELTVIGVTGTNGKTSVSHFIAQVLNDVGETGPCGVIGTLGNGLVGQLQPQSVTTPDPIAVHYILNQLRDRSAKSVVLEASSHGLSQQRLTGVKFNTAVFTNLSRDHLDYHGDMSNYADAKKRLFRTPGLKTAVVNFDDPHASEFLAEIPAGVFTLGYSLHDTPLGLPMDSYPMIFAREVNLSDRGVRMRVFTPQGDVLLKSPLLGRFNASNLLAALGAVVSTGVVLTEAVQRLCQVSGISGRVEVFPSRSGWPTVVVDYAHTPDGLDQVLTSLRDVCQKRLICVFGCGGERDPGKRPMMGEVAARLADHIVVTDDNPRGEDPKAIIANILAGTGKHSSVSVNGDRKTAIIEAIRNADRDDIVLIAGKGHEEYQEINGQRSAFSDRLIVRQLIAGNVS